MPAMNKLSNYKTTVSASNGVTRVTYCSTVIVEHGPDEIVLRTGGWKSVTTKRKMNQASRQFGWNYGVEQKDFEWFVHWKGQRIPFDDKIITLAR